MSDLVEVHIGGIAKVPAKYAPLVKIINETAGAAWQQAANEWVKSTRMSAADLGIEVEEFIAQALEEHAKEQEVKQPKPVPAFNATSTTFLSSEEIAEAEAEAPMIYYPCSLKAEGAE